MSPRSKYLVRGQDVDGFGLGLDVSVVGSRISHSVSPRGMP
jgi:hypothetical protein